MCLAGNLLLLLGQERAHLDLHNLSRKGTPLFVLALSLLL